MVLLDGMPIVSGLSTVYGLSGIPASLIERVEVVKGPASTLYGSEAIGGLINVITRDPARAPVASVDAFSTTYGEHNVDVGTKVKLGGATSLLGVNAFWYDRPRDDNRDGFTDVTLARRISVFDKISFARPDNRVASLAGRYFYEDRWGGQMHWTPEFRGGDSVYGESIYTNRAELIGSYQLPVRQPVFANFSLNTHHQNSVYGNTPFTARQTIGFGQLTAPRTVGRHSLLFGAAVRYTYYQDDTPATALGAQRTWLPGVFVQDELRFADPRYTLLAGVRYDFNSAHGSILSPRLNWKFAPDEHQTWRLGVGNGYRVVSVLCTEDHAALTGARRVVMQENLRPERSYNATLNYTRTVPAGRGVLTVDGSAFYTYFTNKITPDYLTDPSLLIYQNLRGHAVSRGASVNLDWLSGFGLKAIVGATVLDVFQVTPDESGALIRQRQLLTERVGGTLAVSYAFERLGLSLDYTGSLYGPMRLPTLGPLDQRPASSPTFSIQNIQFTQRLGGKVELYGGVKNLLDFRPRADAIARPHDPFDKQVRFDAAGQVVATPDNPQALTFDPTYVYASNQGRRGFLGVRWTL